MLKDNEPVFLVQMLASFPIQNLEFWTQLPMTIQLLLTLAWISNCEIEGWLRKHTISGKAKNSIHCHIMTLWVL